MGNAKLGLHNEQLTLCANTIRMLAVDAVEKANSGHPGMPMGMADLAAVLWLKHLRYNPSDPKWLNRDRFVLSNGHGSMLLYSLLHLAGYGLSLDDLKGFRQWGSKTPGHPESFMTPGVECTTGPLGQGISNAVGLAIGERLMASNYNTAQHAILDHRIFVFAGDGCLMEGVSSEACSLAGHLGLGNIIVIYDDNHISIAGHTKLAFTENVQERYASYGWHVQAIDGHDFSAIDSAISAAVAETSRPSIIAARTLIGKGSPNKADTHDVHGSPLGKAEIEATKKALNWPQEPTFLVPDEVKILFAKRAEELQGVYAEWQKLFSQWSSAEPEKARELKKQVAREVPADLMERLLAALPKDGAAVATRKLSQIVLQELSKQVNSLVGGSADLEPSTLTLISGAQDFQKNSCGKNLRFGVREHGMGAIMNGLSYYGSFIPYGSTFFCFADYMRPTLRLAALSHLPGLFIFTHDSIFLGEDGPTHQPVEHCASLRVIPNLQLFRPADAVETAACYALAAARKDGPCAMVLTRQNLPQLQRPENFRPSDLARGAYVVTEINVKTDPEIVMVATGSEVSLAVEAAKQLPTKKGIRIVSMPCCELFRKQDETFRQKLIPTAAKKVVLEAGSSFGWLGIIDARPEDTVFISLEHFGASAPASVLAEKFGFTPAAVCKKLTTSLSL